MKWLSKLSMGVLSGGCLGLLILPVLGCSDGGDVNTVDVSGTVTIDGKLVEGVEVNFMGEKHAGYGKTDAQGRFQLIQGAVSGRNKVYFSKITGNTDIVISEEEGMDEEQLRLMAESGGRAPDLPKQLIPPEYSDPESTKLFFDVPAGGTSNAHFKLSRK